MTNYHKMAIVIRNSCCVQNLHKSGAAKKYLGYKRFEILYLQNGLAFTCCAISFKTIDQCPWLVEIVSCLFSNDLGWIDYYFISLWYERNVFLLDKVHSTNLEGFTWLFICGTNWLFNGTIWVIWLLIATIWPWNKMTGYRHAPSRLPMNKLKSLLQKKRKVTLFVWKSIQKNTPLSSKIHCYVRNRKGLHLNRYRSNCNKEL